MKKLTNEMLVEYLNDEDKRAMLRKMGYSPELPFIVTCIDDDKAYTTIEVAELLNFSAHHIRYLCREAKIPSVQIGGKGGSYRIYGEEIKKFILKKIHYTSMEKRLNEKIKIS